MGSLIRAMITSSLLVRPKGVQDNAVPSGNAMAALALLQLADFTGDLEQKDEAEKLVASLKNLCLEHPTAFSFWLQAMDYAVGPTQQIALVWPRGSARPVEFLNLVDQKYRPRSVLAASPIPGGAIQPELLLERLPINDEPTAYVCEKFVCQQPTTSLEEFRGLIDHNSSA